jgi:hypothetical protein
MNTLIKCLRKTIYTTRNHAQADKSPFQFSKRDDGVYETSLLGVINGFLPWLTGYVLVASIDPETHKGLALFLKKKWW